MARAVGVDGLLAAKLLVSTDGRRDPVGVGVRADVMEGRGEDIVDMTIYICVLRECCWRFRGSIKRSYLKCLFVLMFG